VPTARAKSTGRKKRQTWPRVVVTVGRHGHTVAVVQRKDGGSLYLRWFDPNTRPDPVSGRPRGSYVWRSLGHADELRAEGEALDLSRLFLLQADRGPDRALTVTELFARYLRDASALKRGQQRAADERRANLWTAFLGAARDLRKQPPDRNDVNRFQAARLAGKLAVPGRRIEPVGLTTVGHDVTFFKGVLTWATETFDAEGRPLLDRNPIRSFKRQRNASPNAPTAPVGWFSRVYRRADAVDSQGLLRPLLALAFVHGWRVSAWLEMWASDIDPRPCVVDGAEWPFGRLRARGDTDKMGREAWVPMTRASQRAAVRLLQGTGVVGDAPVFVAPRAGGPWQPQHALDLLHRAELLAGHAERLAFLRGVAAEVGARVVVRIGRASYPLDEYLARHGAKVEAEPEHAANLVARVNDATGGAWRASIEPEPGRGFHSLRRKWGKDRKGLPLVDVAAAGRWHPGTLLNHYQEADAETTLDVVSHRPRANGRGKG
jgi:hypothetical protein